MGYCDFIDDDLLQFNLSKKFQYAAIYWVKIAKKMPFYCRWFFEVGIIDKKPAIKWNKVAISLVMKIGIKLENSDDISWLKCH